MVKITCGSPSLPRTQLHQQPSVSAWAELRDTPRKERVQKHRLIHLHKKSQNFSEHYFSEIQKQVYRNKLFQMSFNKNTCCPVTVICRWNPPSASKCLLCFRLNYIFFTLSLLIHVYQLARRKNMYPWISEGS